MRPYRNKRFSAMAALALQQGDRRNGRYLAMLAQIQPLERGKGPKLFRYGYAGLCAKVTGQALQSAYDRGAAEHCAMAAAWQGRA